MPRAHPELSTVPELASLDVAWRQPRHRTDARLPPAACALVIGALSAGLWMLIWLVLHRLG